MPEKFAERLRSAREAKGLSQKDLADKAGFQPSAISHFENEGRSPSFANLRKLADALGVTVDYLLGRDVEPKTSGPVAEQIFRNLSQLSDADQRLVADFANMLKQKKDER